MRTFSATLTSQLQRIDGAAFRPVLVFEYPTYRSFLSTSTWTIGGVVVDASLLGILSIDESHDRLGDATVEVVDTPLNRTHVRLTQKISVYLWPVSGNYSGLADEDVLFVGTISSPIVRANGKIRFDAISYGWTHNRKIYSPILESVFPDAGLSIGKNQAVIYGKVPRVPCFLEADNLIGMLLVNISGSATEINVWMQTDFPSNGYIRIGDEAIIYQSRSGGLLQGCLRGVTAPVGGLPSSHAYGDEVMVVEGSYPFIPAAHEIHSVSNVRYGNNNYPIASDKFDFYGSGQGNLHSKILVSSYGVFSDFIAAKTCLADVCGWRDDASGSITGTPWALIERPDHVARHLLRTYGGASAAETAAGDFDAFIGVEIGIYLPDPFQVHEVLAEIARQCGAVITYSGNRWIMRKIQSDVLNLSSPAVTITEADTLRNEDGSSSVAFSTVEIGAIRNRLVFRYGAIPDGSWVLVANREDQNSQAMYGVREGALDLPFLYTSDQAEPMRGEIMARSQGSYGARVTARLSLEGLPIEIGDRVDVHHDLEIIGHHPQSGTYLAGQVVATRKDLTGNGFGSTEVVVMGWP
ncbi:MAG: hypothetical protein HQM00_01805 [Magnetococcales bacterium]|nr:hypothetical protein [Magnetococcales bacterium]